MKKIFKTLLSIGIPLVLIAIPSIAIGLSYVNKNSQENNIPSKPEEVPTQPDNSQKPNIPDNDNISDVPTYQKAYFKDDIDDYVPPKPGIGVDVNEDKTPLIDGQIINENYKYIWDRSVRIGIKNSSSISSSGYVESPGTVWYLDFIKNDDEKYPLTWFMATNLHVVGFLRNLSDYPDVRNVKTFSTESLGFNIHIDSTNDNQTTTNFVSNSLSTLPKTLFVAYDFLDKKPNEMFDKSLLSNPNNLEEMKDFAILEIKFDSEEQARKLTKNIYEKYKTEKLKFAKQTFYGLYERSEISKLNDIYVGGYPWSSSKFTINKVKSNSENNKFGASLSDRRKMSLKNIKNRELIGISDNFADFNFYYEIDEVFYKRIGLSYEPEFTDMEPGASGSMSVNKDNEIIGIFWGKEELTRVGMIDPLISEGFYLNNSFLYPKYDLIHGNVKGQKKSFKDSLIKHHKGKVSNYFGLL